MVTADGPGAPGRGDRTAAEARDDGMTVRRAVLSAAHVDAAEARKTEFTEPFQDLITRYAWGEIWTRPGLDRRMRSAVTLTALVARDHWDEFAMHVRAARRNGLSAEEIQEILLQVAIYLGVPTANHAFAVAEEQLARYEQEDGSSPSSR
ncbi:MAG TPA: 4-carboxymuconolactone decarboxylase [Intrasporangium sp.]|uniref:4-carboxymuconolactone decarboxylase n=1 Tax=Intrasporangium sp. TaxID=1925024 RepID=UPI002B4930C6|nr:4-carboxymuconolactone decarboxylase [Intrasporangium sp.]HKX69097.1 4-carboxymuconolactone decarboxylase [Intrasporangium sp.]